MMILLETKNIMTQILTIFPNHHSTKNLCLSNFEIQCHYEDPLFSPLTVNGQTNKVIQARIAQLVAYRLGTGEVPGSHPDKGENFSVKISNWIVRI